MTQHLYLRRREELFMYLYVGIHVRMGVIYKETKNKIKIKVR